MKMISNAFSTRLIFKIWDLRFAFKEKMNMISVPAIQIVNRKSISGIRLWIILAVFIFPFFLHAGKRDFAPADSVPAKDTVKVKIHSPKRAAIYSAVLPGLGQVYNKKYWKVPIVYAGFGGLGYGFFWNHGYFKDYRDALRLRYDDDPNTNDEFTQYSDADLVTLKNYYQRYRDLCVIGMVALYTLQVLDATVDAHLYYFDVSDDLTMRLQPALYSSPRGMAGGIGIQIGFR